MIFPCGTVDDLMQQQNLIQFLVTITTTFNYTQLLTAAMNTMEGIYKLISVSNM